VPAKAFIEHAKRSYEDWLGQPICSLVTGELLSELAEPMSFKDLLSSLEEETKQRLGDVK